MLVWNKETVAAAAADFVDSQRWLAEFETAFGQVAARFVGVRVNVHKQVLLNVHRSLPKIQDDGSASPACP